jgi:hypothetical protein
MGRVRIYLVWCRRMDDLGRLPYSSMVSIFRFVIFQFFILVSSLFVNVYAFHGRATYVSRSLGVDV